jgi:hypothetical protein
MSKEGKIEKEKEMAVCGDKHQKTLFPYRETT